MLKPPTTQGQRIKLARKTKGLTQKKLAEKAGFTGHTIIQNYEKDRRGHEKPNLSLLIKIADICDVSLDWILTGKESKNKNTLSQDDTFGAQDFTYIINWEEIREWKMLRKSMSLASREQIPLIGGEKRNCFGLRVMDDSMLSTSVDVDDSFKVGDGIIVDPDLIPSDGDYVIASLDENEPIVLRKYVLSDKGYILVPLNNKYPTLSLTEKVCLYGVVIGQHRKFNKR